MITIVNSAVPVIPLVILTGWLLVILVRVEEV
jgi:hypothetical protein